MRNCLILGSGRSGTSMVAGSLAATGYFMGDHLHRANAGNPKGIFEDRTVNRLINEPLLAQVLPWKPRLVGRWLFPDRPGPGQRWLARLPVGTPIPPLPRAIDRIRRLTQREPFCFKDPRFSYTLPVWRPFLRNTGFVCVFRDPANTAMSILKECREERYLHSLAMTFERAVEAWTLMYRSILEIHRHEGDWLFLHYDQVLSGDGLDRLEVFLQAPVDRSFPETALRRSGSDREVPEETRRAYELLRGLAVSDAVQR